MPKDPTGDPNAHPSSKFSSGMSGTCLCGSVTVTINDSELFTKKRGHLCHCANCRKVAGSYVASNLLIEQEKVTIQDRDGTLKVYEDKETLSGNPVYRSFCSTDGKYVLLRRPSGTSLVRWDADVRLCVLQSCQVRDCCLSWQSRFENGHVPSNSAAGSGRFWAAQA